MDKQELLNRIRLAATTAPRAEEILSVALFGSYAYGTPKENSDVDLLVELTETRSLMQMAELQIHFEEVLGKKVDLLTPQRLDKYIREEVLAKAQPIYANRQALSLAHS